MLVKEWHTRMSPALFWTEASGAIDNDNLQLTRVHRHALAVFSHIACQARWPEHQRTVAGLHTIIYTVESVFGALCRKHVL